MSQASMQPAPLGTLCKACDNATYMSCTYCANAPSPSGRPVPTTYYCSMTCASLDWPAHQAHCLAARERRAVFEAAKTLHSRYYINCQMEYEGAVKYGFKISTNESYDNHDLMKDVNKAVLTDQHHKAFLACFGGYNPQYSRQLELSKYLKHLGHRVSDVTLRMKRDRLFSYREFANIPKDQHKIVKLTMSNGERYALDIAGGQFGLYAPIVEWDLYILFNVQRIEASQNIVFT